jgi:hypothetical protein
MWLLIAWKNLLSDQNVECILKYLVKGVEPGRESQRALQIELEELLPSHNAITILPVVEGYSVEIEVNDIAPFSRTSYEPYIAEQILSEAVNIRCQPRGETQLQLLKARFY